MNNKKLIIIIIFTLLVIGNITLIFLNIYKDKSSESNKELESNNKQSEKVDDKQATKSSMQIYESNNMKYWLYIPENAKMKDWYSNVKVTEKNAKDVEYMKTDYLVFQDAVQALKKYNMEFTNTKKGEFIDKRSRELADNINMLLTKYNKPGLQSLEIINFVLLNYQVY